MADRSTHSGPVAFSEKLTASPMFTSLFREGMALVEETAAYLDGPGRTDAKRLDRSASMIYATESMRLTTRLMQLASWLLLHRAVKEGEMSLQQASREKSKVKFSAPEPGPGDTIAKLPKALQRLIERSVALQTQVRRLDATMHAPAAAADAAENPVVSQLGMLRAAFESRL
jgi:regulator of CtrA degradation